MPEPVWLVSVHDLMPDTIGAVQDLVQQLDQLQVTPLTLLVVPGGAWSTADIEWLRSRQNRGDNLAGHGWIHLAAPARDFYTSIHSRFFSRGVAEHLPLDSQEISTLIRNCYDWFVANDFAEPDLYVPPAWAMGRISRQQLRELPFQSYESLSGVYDATNDLFQRLPLMGFQADTKLRALSLRVSNTLNIGAAKINGRLRVAIHPHDLELRMREDLLRLLSTPARCRAYD
ncbi:MAG: polysaccharide deacetylase family protein [Gammaproteobacteria bacterium]|nr:polysaccharide deacetylase family protein [Gammaproteobacteria bacterium]MDH3767227.1 polysaccharide deacetylase family protein [Gammaproteobacteria bacterium]